MLRPIAGGWSGREGGALSREDEMFLQEMLQEDHANIPGATVATAALSLSVSEDAPEQLHDSPGFDSYDSEITDGDPGTPQAGQESEDVLPAVASTGLHDPAPIAAAEPLAHGEDLGALGEQGGSGGADSSFALASSH